MDTPVVFFQTCGYDTLRFCGPLDNPFKQKLPNAKLDMNGFSGTAWLMNIHKVSESKLIGFMHRETHSAKPDCLFYMGIAYSTDSGASWRYLGDVLSPFRNDGDPSNIGGMPLIVVGKYFYVYFNEHTRDYERYISVGRALVSEVVEAAAKGKVPSFQKYSDGSWTDAMTSLASNIVPDSRIRYDKSFGPNWERSFDVHTDAAYCAVLGKYLLLVQTHGLGYLLLYTSPDGLNWGEETVVDFAPAGGIIQAHCNFAGFVGASDDCNTVGSDFYIYYPRKGWGPNNPGTERYYRRQVTIGPADPATFRASEGFAAVQMTDRCWSYQQWDGKAFSDLMWDGPYCRWKGVSNALVGYNWQCPADGADAVRVWTAPRAGAIRITGTVRKQVKQTGGDAIVATIKHNATNLWSRPIAGDDVQGASHDVSADMRKGDKLYFIVNRNGTVETDTNEWDPTVIHNREK